MAAKRSRHRGLRRRIDGALARLSGYYDDNVASLFHKACRIRRNDLIVASFERSGRTWVRFFIATYLSQCHGLGVRVDWNNFVQLTPGTMCKREGLLDCPLPPDTPRVIFSHRRSVGRYFPGRKVVYITRHFLDIVVSYYFFYKNRPWSSIRSASANEFVTTEFDLAEAVHRINYFSRQLGKAAEVLILPYEYLHHHPEDGFRRMVEFRGGVYDNRAFGIALEHASFASMRKMEIEHMGERAPEAFHTRLGGVRGFRSHLEGQTVERVQASLERQLAPPLNAHYLGRADIHPVRFRPG